MPQTFVASTYLVTLHYLAVLRFYAGMEHLPLSLSLSLWSFISLEQEQGEHVKILAEIIQGDNLANRTFHDIISTANVVCFSDPEEVKLLSVVKRPYGVAHCMIAYWCLVSTFSEKVTPHSIASGVLVKAVNQLVIS